GLVDHTGLRRGGHQGGRRGCGARDPFGAPVPRLAGVSDPVGRCRVRGGPVDNGRACAGVALTAKNGSRPGTDAVAGARMALGTFTVFPVRVERVDRPTAGWAMSWAPVLGALLGLVPGVVVA